MKPVQVVVLGTEPGGRGGIAQSLPTLLDTLSARGQLRAFLATHRSHPKQRLRPALRALHALPGHLARTREAGAASVVFAHVGGPVCLARTAPLLAVARAGGAQVWVQLHSAAIDPWLVGVRSHALRTALAPAHTVFVPTPSFARRLTSAGVPNVQVLPPALPADVLAAMARPIHVSRRRRRLHLLCASRLVEGKGVELVIDALVGTQDHLTLAGDGPLADSLRDRARSQGLSEQLTMTGWAHSLDPLLAHSDVFVLPSTHDTYGLAVAHALAAGVPCVVADTPVTRETWGDAAVAVPPTAQAIAGAVASLRGARRDVADAGRRLVERSHSEWLTILSRSLKRVGGCEAS